MKYRNEKASECACKAKNCPECSYKETQESILNQIKEIKQTKKKTGLDTDKTFRILCDMNLYPSKFQNNFRKKNSKIFDKINSNKKVSSITNNDNNTEIKNKKLNSKTSNIKPIDKTNKSISKKALNTEKFDSLSQKNREKEIETRTETESDTAIYSLRDRSISESLPLNFNINDNRNRKSFRKNTKEGKKMERKLSTSLLTENSKSDTFITTMLKEEIKYKTSSSKKEATSKQSLFENFGTPPSSVCESTEVNNVEIISGHRVRLKKIFHYIPFSNYNGNEGKAKNCKNEYINGNVGADVRLDSDSDFGSLHCKTKTKRICGEEKVKYKCGKKICEKMFFGENDPFNKYFFGNYFRNDGKLVRNESGSFDYSSKSNPHYCGSFSETDSLMITY